MILDNWDDEDEQAVEERRQTQPELSGATLEQRLAELPAERPKVRKRKDGRGRGSPRARALIQRDIDRVNELMIEGAPRYEILRDLMKRKVSVRTVDRYIAYVNERRKAERELAKPHEIEASIARLTDLSRKAQREKAWAAVRGFESMLLDIRGVRAPEKHDVRTVVAVAPIAEPEVDFDAEMLAAGVSDEQLVAIKQAAAAMMGKAAPVGLIGDTTIRHSHE